MPCALKKESVRFALLLGLLAHSIVAHSQVVDDTARVANHHTALPKARGFRTFPPLVLPNGTFQLRNQPATFARKMARGSLFILGIDGAGYAGLALLDTTISGWNSGSFANYRGNMERAFTSPPVVDHDKWYINYIGHPYAGALFYNAVRSQNAKMWQSSLFCLGNMCWCGNTLSNRDWNSPAFKTLSLLRWQALCLANWRIGALWLWRAMGSNGTKWQR
jgi:hypothetical protein